MQQRELHKLNVCNVAFTFILSNFTKLLLAKLDQREHHVRESWVKAMEARLVRDELEKCQKAEGVNHYENCRWLSEKYLTMLKENKVCVFTICLDKDLNTVSPCIGERLQAGRRMKPPWRPCCCFTSSRPQHSRIYLRDASTEMCCEWSTSLCNWLFAFHVYGCIVCLENYIKML
jgi:hypothetical protein